MFAAHNNLRAAPFAFLMIVEHTRSTDNSDSFKYLFPVALQMLLNLSVKEHGSRSPIQAGVPVLSPVLFLKDDPLTTLIWVPVRLSEG